MRPTKQWYIKPKMMSVDTGVLKSRSEESAAGEGLRLGRAAGTLSQFPSYSRDKSERRDGQA